MICINTQSQLTDYHKTIIAEVKNWFIKKYNLPDLNIVYSNTQTCYYQQSSIHLSIQQFYDLPKHPLYKHGKTMLKAYILMLLHELTHHLQKNKYRKSFQIWSWYATFEARNEKEYYKVRTEKHANLNALYLFKNFIEPTLDKC